jgi:radical SAM protein with 4Fe4S-binding SPASM domain
MFREDELKDALDKVTKTAIEEGVELRLGASLSEDLVIDEGLPNKCSHPWEYCYIDYAGNVGYCDHLIGHKALMLGNLNKNSFKEIWNNDKFQSLREAHNFTRKGGTEAMQLGLPHCNWCYKRRYVDFEEETNSDAKNRIISTSCCNSLFEEKIKANDNTTQFLKGRDLPFGKVF